MGRFSGIFGGDDSEDESEDDGPAVEEHPRVEWRAPFDGGSQFSMPTVVDGTAYVAETGMPTPALAAFDTATGTAAWSYRYGNDFTAPVVADGMVYTTGKLSGEHITPDSPPDLTTKEHLWAFDAASGTVEWTAETEFPNAYSPVVVDGTAYVTLSARGTATVAAFDIGNGWRWSASYSTNVSGQMLYHDGTVFAPVAPGGGIVALDAGSGEELWRADVGPSVQDRIFRAPTAVDETVIATHEEIAAFSTATGECLWRATEHGSNKDVTVDDGRVFVTGYTPDDTPRLRALSVADGTEEWSVTASKHQSVPTVAGGTVYTTVHKDEVRAIDAETGEVLWTIPGIDKASPVMVVDGTVFVGSDGSVFAIEADHRDSAEDASVRSQVRGHHTRTTLTPPETDPRDEASEGGPAYCMDCGEALPEGTTPNYCPNCGTELR